MEVRPKADGSLGWAFRPDAKTLSSLARGRAKFKEHPELGSDKPHEGGLVQEAIEKEKASLRPSVKTKRRKKMAKKIGKSASKKKTVQAAPASDGKTIPLKKICEGLDIEPKAARVKLRRLIAKGEIKFHETSQRWEFSPAQAKQVRQLLAA